MKKKVLLLIYELTGGGAENVLVGIANHMDKSLYDVTVMTIIDCSCHINVLNDDISYKYLFKGRFKENRVFFRLFYRLSPNFLHKQFIKDHYDVEIAALEGISAKIISGCDDLSIKKIAIIHANANNIAWPSRQFKNLNQECKSYNSFNHLIFVSNNTKKNFLDKFNIEESKSLVVYNPFNIDYIRNISNDIVTDFRKKREILFCAVGRLEEVKGFDRLIKAFVEIYKNYNNIELLILGEGKEKQNLLNLIKKYRLDDVITILDYRLNPYKYLKISDCYICSSRSEGLSSTVIEAMIVGIPIIATDCGGMGEIVEDNQCAIIVDNDINGLIEGMEQFMSNYNNYIIVQNNYSEIIEKFSYDKYFHKINEII